MYPYEKSLETYLMLPKLGWGQDNWKKTLLNNLVVWVLWYINLCRLFNAKSIFMKIVLFQKIQFSISTQLKCKYSLIVKKTFYFKFIQFSQAVVIQLIRFSISTDFVYIHLNVKSILY